MNARMSLTVLFAAASVAVNAANITVTSFDEHQSAATALRAKPGDTITLPALESGSYAVGNARFASISGDVVTAVEPGILAVFQIGSDGVAIDAVLPVVILPQPTAGGRVFICNESHWSWGQDGWCTGEGAWINVADNSTNDHPRLPGDIAMIGRWNDGWGQTIVVSSDIVVGAIYYGNYRDFDAFGNTAYCSCIRSANASTATVTFSRGDKGNALVQLCPNLPTAERKCMFGFGEGLTITSTRDVDIDFGWDESATGKNLGYFKQFDGSILNIPEGKTFKFINSSPHEGRAEDQPSCHRDIELLGIISGAGTLQNSSRENMLCDFSDATAFTGTIRESGFMHDFFNRDATTWFLNCTTLNNAALDVSGYVVRTDYRTFPAEQAAGYARIGLDHTWPGQSEVSNRLPGRALVLNGGQLSLLNEQTAWSAGAVNTYSTALLAVSNGFTRIEVKGTSANSYPETLFEATNVSHANKGTIAIRSNGLWSQHGEYCTRVSTRFPWFASEAVGGIVPWIVAWMDQPDYGTAGGWESLRFPAVDEEGNLRELSDTVYAEGKNAVVDGADLAISADMTVNSLVVHTPYQGNCDIGEGKTLTISSGGLILNSANKVGRHDWGSTERHPSCGTIAFGATAYVFSNNANETGDGMSWIWTPVVAPYGFVSAFAGYLTLCGDQTGIDDEIVVQAGKLTLGLSVTHSGADLVVPCQIDVPVRIVGGGSTLKLAANSHLASDQNVYFDDVGGFAGKLDIPAGTTETCMKCYVDGVTLARGTWGATGSGADNIDDEHFSGLGVLKVRKDELNRAMKIVVR